MIAWGSMKKTARAEIGPLCFGIICALPFLLGVAAEWLKGWLR